MKLIKNPVVCERVAAATVEVSRLPLLLYKSVPDRVRWLQKHLEVARQDEHTISIRLPGEDPTQAAKIVNAVVEEYFNFSVQRATESQQRVLQILEQEIDRNQTVLKRQQQDLKELIKEAHSDPTTRQLAAARYSSLCGVEAKVRELQLESKVRMAAADTQIQQSESDAVLTAKAKLDRAIAEAQGKVLDLAADEIKASLAAIEGEGSKHDAVLNELEFRRMEFDVTKATYQDLLAQRERLRLKSREPDRITVLKRAKLQD